MRQEERDVYVIPPNFIEGGTLMGGMLKTRNAIEAGVLGALTALPVLRLDLSLTARVIILCLTTLPLVLAALIGIGGESLSAFLLQFVSYLRNRRVLNQIGTGSKKGLLPSWAKKEQTADPDLEELPRSHRRFQVDVKKREVSQHKTFLEQAEKPLNPIADYVPIEKIVHGVIKTRDHRYIKIVEVAPVNFLLRSAQEQRGIIYSFISYLKIAPTKVQFKVLTKRADIDRHVDGVRQELERETDPHCRMLQEDYLRLIRDLGSREAITRRFFLIFEHEPLPGTKRGQEEEEAIASLQTAARTAANYLRQCGNIVLMPEEQDEAAAEILYHILCRQESNDRPFADKAKQVVAEYLGAGRDVNNIPANEFYAPAEIDFTHGRYICIDGMYYAYLLVPSDGFKAQVPAGWLSLLVNAGDGIDLDVFLTRQPKDRMIRKLGQQLRINRSKIRETSDTNTDFDDLDGAIRSGYFLKDGLGNNEDFYYLNLLVTVTAGSVEELEWKCAEMKKLLLSQDMNVQPCSFCEEQAFLSSLPLVSLEKHLFERSKRNVLTLGAASCYPYTSYEMCDDNATLDDPENPGQYRTMPVLGDLYDTLKEVPDTKRLANIINRLVHGSAKTFNQQTNVSLDNKYTVLDISELTGDLLTVGMFVALDYVWDKAKENRTEEKAIFIDECWQLIGANSNRLAAEFVLEIFKIIRGYGGSAICATQDINDFFALEDGKYGKGIINNAKTKILLNLEDEEARRVQSLLHLSEAEVMEITHFERGSGLISTNNNNVTVEIKCSQMEKELITTDRRELQELLNRTGGQKAG